MKRWPITSLGEVSESVMGQAPPGSETNSDGKGTPFVKAGEFGERRPIIREWTTKPLKFAKSTDVFVCVVGATCGKLNLGADCAIGRSVAAIRPNEKMLNQGFLYAFLQGWTQRLRSGSQGSAQGVITRDMLASIPIPVPPLAEQERIMKLLDEADELRKLRAKADRRAGKLIAALFHEMFGDPVTNSKGWPVKPFGDLVNNQDGRRKPVKKSDRAERQGKYPYYGASGIIDYVEKYLFDETALLIGEDGANLLARSTPIAFLAHGKYWVNNHAHVVTENGYADLIYLCENLNLRDLKDYVTGSAQPKLNQANLNRMPIPVPPLPLQKEFAQRVIEIRALEAEQAASRTRLDALFQSMLHRAFNGDL